MILEDRELRTVKALAGYMKTCMGQLLISQENLSRTGLMWVNEQSQGVNVTGLHWPP